MDVRRRRRITRTRTSARAYRRGSTAAQRRYPSYALSRFARRFRPYDVKDFTFTYQPFNMTITHGTGGGINFYNQGGVPSAPTTVAGGNAFSFNFSLSGMQTLINGGGGASNGGGVNNINYTEYTALFDSYRIIGIEIKMVYNADSQSQTMTTGFPNLMMVNDFDDSNNTTTAALLQYDSLKITQMGTGRPFKTWNVRPRLQATVQTTAGSVLALTPPADGWLDSAAYDAQYFGVKGLVDTQVTGGALTNIGYITFYVKAKVQFKNTR